VEGVFPLPAVIVPEFDGLADVGAEVGQDSHLGRGQREHDFLVRIVTDEPEACEDGLVWLILGLDEAKANGQ